MFDFERLNDLTIGVIGDFALDIYWYADMTKSELSRETPHYPLPVVREKISLGAAGNVAANLAALKPSRLAVCGVCGDDWRGTLMREQFASLGADTSGLFCEAGRMTNAYCKPMRMGISEVIYEDPRLDFAASAAPEKKTEAKILAWLDMAEKTLDALCVCDQFACGILTPAIVERIRTLGIRVYVDSRSRIAVFGCPGTVLKPNEVECAQALKKLGLAVDEDPAVNADRLGEATGSDILLTLGEKGCLWRDAASRHSTAIPAIAAEGPIDICGAGDTFISAFASFHASGASPEEAASFAACASHITIRQIGTTGTASREDIFSVWNASDSTERR